MPTCGAVIAKAISGSITTSGSACWRSDQRRCRTGSRHPACRRRAAHVPQEEQHEPIRTDTRVASEQGFLWYGSVNRACRSHLAKVGVAGSNPVVRSRETAGQGRCKPALFHFQGRPNCQGPVGVPSRTRLPSRGESSRALCSRPLCRWRPIPPIPESEGVLMPPDVAAKVPTWEAGRMAAISEHRWRRTQ